MTPATPSLTAPPFSALRDRVRRQLLDRLGRGEFAAGQRLNLARLALELGASTTPVREALTQLELDGLVASEPNRGFFVPSLSFRELEEIYPILGALEALAVRSTGSYPPAAARRLRDLNRRVGRSSLEPIAALGADRTWHEHLVAACGNNSLLEEIARLRRRLAPFELEFMRESGQRPESAADHDEIAGLIEQESLGRAASAVERHWRRSVDFFRPG